MTNSNGLRFVLCTTDRMCWPQDLSVDLEPSEGEFLQTAMPPEHNPMLALLTQMQKQPIKFIEEQLRANQGAAAGAGLLPVDQSLGEVSLSRRPPAPQVAPGNGPPGLPGRGQPVGIKKVLVGERQFSSGEAPSPGVWRDLPSNFSVLHGVRIFQPCLMITFSIVYNACSYVEQWKLVKAGESLVNLLLCRNFFSLELGLRFLECSFRFSPMVYVAQRSYL